MEEKLAISRHFFKVLMPGFQKKLNLPPAFCKKLKQEKSEHAILRSQSEQAILRSRKGTWRINVCRNCEGLISFKVGWPEFVYHHGLRVGDFVVFEHAGKLHFNVLVFDPTACEKEFLVKCKREHEEETEAVNPSCHPDKTRREPEKESVVSYNSKNPYFILTMKPCHARKSGQVTIPAEFVRSNDLGRKTSVTLRDPRGRVSPVRLLVQTIPRSRLRMTRGWRDFYASNELKVGDVCVFDLNRRSLRSTTILFDVKIFPSPL